MLAPGAQVLVRRQDERVLFQRRSDNGVWELPAGACEPNQTFVECAAEELRQETGIQLSVDSFRAFGSISGPELHTLRYPNGDVVQAYAICFVVDLPEDAVITPEPEEVSEFCWADLSQPPRPLHPPTAEAIRLYESFLRNGQFVAH